ncbi:bacteriocin biosynthesis cyclodehydratase domain-containing protein [Microbacterium invictum]|uniref:Bacteriocin biosynthesis cyclodehydratase domain-containing protein n=1 Tax=Microbacterium invictum TaxID=515415 RepID=A0AA40SM90_9MICO|nr:bacteriocin biosynthesis cyclodehydratase domain-containing protein [Microbacterium invictum]
MLRLAPSHPPLWRTPSSIQLGADATTRLSDVTAWQEQLLDALIGGIPDAMVVPLATAYGATAAEVHAFIDRIGAALSSQPLSPLPVRVEVPSDLGPADRDALVTALQGGELHVESMTGWSADEPTPGAPVVVVASHLVDPRQTVRLMAADITHVPLQLSGDRVTAGPVVVPGQTACLSCVHAHRAEADSSWPMIAVQLLARPTVPTARALIIEAALLAARLLHVGGEIPSRSVSVSGETGRRSWHVHRPHPRCLCRSLEGTVTADAPGTRSPAPTTATAIAPHG